MVRESTLSELRDVLHSVAICSTEHRAIVVTPVLGSYGSPSAWWIDVEGSPPKASIIVNVDLHPLTAFSYSLGRMKKISKEETLEFLFDLVDSWRDVKYRKPFRIKPKQ